MGIVAISKLNASTSEYIALVKAGEEVLITVRGEAVAQVLPAGDATGDNAKRVELARRGILRPGKGRASWETVEDLPMARVHEDAINAVVDADRRETPARESAE